MAAGLADERLGRWAAGMLAQIRERCAARARGLRRILLDQPWVRTEDGEGCASGYAEWKVYASGSGEEGRTLAISCEARSDLAEALLRLARVGGPIDVGLGDNPRRWVGYATRRAVESRSHGHGARLDLEIYLGSTDVRLGLPSEAGGSRLRA
jgi:hypothetical protein